MTLTRRDLLKASAAIASAIGLGVGGLHQARKALALDQGLGGLPVVWLQGQCCTGCSVSLLNSIKYGTIDALLLSVLDLKYHPNVMAAAGTPAVDAAEETLGRAGYVLVVEGAIPANNGGEYCEVWPGMTALEAVTQFAGSAAFILAVGTCAAFGGIPGGSPNPTGAKGVMNLGLPTDVTNRIINIPGCPAHPDWVVGTVAYLLANGRLPALDSYRRPIDNAIPFFKNTVHDGPCPFRDSNPGYMTKYDTAAVRGVDAHDDGSGNTMPPNCLSCHRSTSSNVPQPRVLSDALNCLYAIGCRGRWTYADCPTRKWNAGAAGAAGVNWCVAAGCPCHGCTEADFPDGKEPFFYLGGTTS